MHKFVFIVFVLLAVTLAGCKELQPVTVVNCQTDTVTLVDTTIVTIQDKDILKSFIECDSSNTAQWIDNIRLSEIIDSLKCIGVQVVVKSQVVYKDKNKTIEKVIIEKSKPIVIYKIHPLTWAAFILCFVFMICFIIAFIYAYKFSKK